MNIAVLGSGYVGLVTAAVFADLGNRVIGIDIDAARIARLNRGESPIYEHGLDEMLQYNREQGRLSFTTDTADAVRACEIVFIAVGTPPAADGSTDLAQVCSAARAIAETADGHRVVVDKSTVPVGTAALVAEILREHARPGASFDVLSNPEFLREGTAIEDALRPDRVVIGAPSSEAAQPLVELYQPLDCPILVTDVPSAELIKYASNTFLALKIAFANTLADLCEQVGADVRMVAKGCGADPRIGPAFLHAGIGYGGSCLPKDVSSLVAFSRARGLQPVLFEAVQQINAERVPQLLRRMEAALGGLAGTTVTVLGLTFKPNTDDLRESRALELCRRLLAAGATVRAHDPLAMKTVAALLPDITYCPTAMEAATGADAVALATEWREYAAIDLAALRAVMRGDLLVDGRNCFSRAQAEKAGLRYIGIGHGTAAVAAPGC